MEKRKKLYVTATCLAVYNSSILVPANLSLEEAIQYAKDHIQEISIGDLEYISDSDELDEENCCFEDDEDVEDDEKDTETKKLQNTCIQYLYRDSSNYKKLNQVVISGCMSDVQIDMIIACLNESEYFIPRQVGLPEERFDDITEDDGCWFELSKENFSHTNKRPTVDLSSDELVANFVKVKGNWDDTIFWG